MRPLSPAETKSLMLAAQATQATFQAQMGVMRTANVTMFDAKMAVVETLIVGLTEINRHATIDYLRAYADALEDTGDADAEAQVEASIDDPHRSFNLLHNPPAGAA